MKFKNLPLSAQLSLIFASFILCFALIFSTTLTISIRNSASEDLYEFLEYTESTQVKNLSYRLYSIITSNRNSTFNSVILDNINTALIPRLTDSIKSSITNNTILKPITSSYLKTRFDTAGSNFILADDNYLNKISTNTNLSDSENKKFFDTVLKNYKSQKEKTKNYYYDFKDSGNNFTIYYKLTKLDNDILDEVKSLGKSSMSESDYALYERKISAYIDSHSKFNAKGIVTYSYDSSANILVESMLKNIFPFIIAGTILAIFIGIILSRYISKPLKGLKGAVNNIGIRNWDTPLHTDRGDEIGELTNSIESMRKQLIKTHEQEQWMLQKISHELKTPVMIIRSYAQAVNDGIFPKGTLKDSIDTIDNEALRLNNRIRDLLYLTKLNYMSKQSVSKAPINISDIIADTIELFNAKKGNISISSDIPNCNVLGIPEQLKVVFENLIDNSLRYAESIITITSIIEKDRVMIELFNDGENIDKNVMSNIFEPFHKGVKGNYGLGLSIAKNIIDIHNGEITVQNRENGVSFLVYLDLCE